MRSGCPAIPSRINLAESAFSRAWIKETPENFDLIANVDSLTEMSSEQAIEYFRFAHQRAEIFLSINHEINSFRVYDLPKMACLSATSMRYGCSMRPGYMEECFLCGLAREQRQPSRWPWQMQ